MTITLEFNEEERTEAQNALSAWKFIGCLFDVANMLKRATDEEPWDAEKIREEFWRICHEDWDIDPYSGEI